MSRRLSSFYEGASGAAFTEWQVRATESMSRVVARKFASFVRPGETVLDFGCGNGAVLAALQGVTRLGVEPNAASASLARKRGIQVVGSLAEVAESSVDTIISHHALEHCLNPLGELTEMRRVLKAPGRLVLVVPIEDLRQRSHRRHRLNDRNHHLFTWTPLLLGNLLSEAGFAVESARARGKAWPPGAAILWRRLPSFGYEFVSRAWSLMSKQDEILAVASQE